MGISRLPDIASQPGHWGDRSAGKFDAQCLTFIVAGLTSLTGTDRECLGADVAGSAGREVSLEFCFRMGKSLLRALGAIAVAPDEPKPIELGDGDRLDVGVEKLDRDSGGRRARLTRVELAAQIDRLAPSVATGHHVSARRAADEPSE